MLAAWQVELQDGVIPHIGLYLQLALNSGSCTQKDLIGSERNMCTAPQREPHPEEIRARLSAACCMCLTNQFSFPRSLFLRTNLMPGKTSDSWRSDIEKRSSVLSDWIGSAHAESVVD